VNEEMVRARAPGLVGASGLGMLGPTLIQLGTEEQKRRYLPKILTAEEIWCQGFSEPNAGSDLASLQTRAVRDGDEWVINGVKIFTSGAHRADYCWLAARTDPQAPKHKGVSMFIVDLKSPGITIHPLHTLADYRTNLTYWENVRVPAKNLVGEVNRGWYLAAAALDFERVALFPWGRLEFEFDELVKYCKQTIRKGKPLSKQPEVRKRLAALSIELSAMKLLSVRTAWIIAAGRIPNYEASMLKMWATEFQQHLGNAGMQIAGLYGLLWKKSKHAAQNGLLNYRYRYAVMPTFGGGSSELMRNIIAQRGMGLPR
ncbi:MAG: acyl-CoA dehydrogenase family protein, partial [Chloroflexi bacterium]|nr:acyl-CoA dehydrogenase family protein [Chloroflexota bacterium]